MSLLSAEQEAASSLRLKIFTAIMTVLFLLSLILDRPLTEAAEIFLPTYAVGAFLIVYRNVILNPADRPQRDSPKLSASDMAKYLGPFVGTAFIGVLVVANGHPLGWVAAALGAIPMLIFPLLVLRAK